MKYFILIGSLILGAASSYGGFQIGQYHQKNVDQLAAVNAGAAYWNMKTRQFTFGDPNTVNLVNTDVLALMQDARLPQRKPKIH